MTICEALDEAMSLALAGKRDTLSETQTDRIKAHLLYDHNLDERRDGDRFRRIFDEHAYQLLFKGKGRRVVSNPKAGIKLTYKSKFRK